MVVSTIILILATAIMPLARVTATRQREMELRRDLREIPHGDRQIQGCGRAPADQPLDRKPDDEGYPPDLETLVEGVTAANDQAARKLKFLRRVPIDPMTHDDEWGMRSYQEQSRTPHGGAARTCSTCTRSSMGPRWMEVSTKTGEIGELGNW